MNSEEVEKELINFLVEKTNRSATSSFQNYLRENFGKEVSKEKINFAIEELTGQGIIVSQKTFGDERIVIKITDKGKSLYEDGHLS